MCRDDGIDGEAGLWNRENPAQNLKARHADMRDDVSRQKHSKQIQQHDQKQYANDHRQHRRVAEGEVGKKQNRGDTPGVTMIGMANGVTAGWR